MTGMLTTKITSFNVEKLINNHRRHIMLDLFLANYLIKCPGTAVQSWVIKLLKGIWSHLNQREWHIGIVGLWCWAYRPYFTFPTGKYCFTSMSARRSLSTCLPLTHSTHKKDKIVLKLSFLVQDPNSFCGDVLLFYFWKKPYLKPYQ